MFFIRSFTKQNAFSLYYQKTYYVADVLSVMFYETYAHGKHPRRKLYICIKKKKKKEWWRQQNWGKDTQSFSLWVVYPYAIFALLYIKLSCCRVLSLCHRTCVFFFVHNLHLIYRVWKLNNVFNINVCLEFSVM